MSIGLIGEHHVAKRRKPSSLDACRLTAASHTSAFPRKTPQRPIRPQRGPVWNSKPAETAQSIKIEPAAQSKPFRFTGRAADRQPAPRRRSAGFSIPLSSVGTVVVIAGIVFAALVALNWEGLPEGVTVSRRFPLEPAADMAEAGRKLASYTNVQFPASDSGFDTDSADAIPLNDLTQMLEWSPYRVKKNDTVSGIAKRFSLSQDAIIAANNIRNVRRLPENTVLRIPNMDGIPYTVKKGDTLEKISQAMNVPLNAILDANDMHTSIVKPNEVLFIPGARMDSSAMKLALGELMVYPVQGRLTDSYDWRNDPFSGERRFHAALDLAAPTGTRVQSVMDGKVSMVGYLPTFGNYVIIGHSGGYQSLYAHLNSISVKKGAPVKQAEKIGEVGETGKATGPHLHFAVYKNGRPHNPLDLLYK